MWWRRPSDPIRSLFIALGKRLPLVFDLYLRQAGGWQTQTPTVVYSDGHSGTSSLYLSLIQAGVKPAFLTHMLYPHNIKTRPHYPKGVGWIYYKGLIERRRPVRLISMVRNPVERCLSAFFHSEFDHVESSPHVSTDALVQRFAQYSRQQEERDWFDAEMLPALGIDVYANAFPAATGFQVIERDNITLLILRLELENSLKERAVADFVGLSDFKWERLGQVGSMKAYGDTYRQFKTDAKLPADSLDRLLSRKLARHFYTDAERQQTLERWS